ncbi:hypothetical protein [Micromonospora echinofusca]|uniref:Heparin binding hemagglutinin HbhA n=1 Tax=Micromonospora echinofusca TaxID=47858 RepID=A0ABS3VTU2_MICEH|nr:hypothetical protein [Micromonospora echinofusca]MBO4207783.1 hypothetical protein [Micromonospora echinofusca]
MTQQTRTTRIPAPLYAAAGAGELAYQQLRKLPTVVTELGGRAVSTTVELREKAVATLRTADLREKAVTTLRTANTTAAGLREKAVPADLDLDRLRTVAARNAAVVVAGAHAAQERALAAYGALVARGERVVGSGVVQAADTVNADMEVTEAELVEKPAEPAPAEATTAPAEATTATEAAATTATEAAATPATVAEVVESKPKATRPRAARKPAAASTATPSAKLPTKRTRPAAK